MPKCCVFVDGENLRHSIVDLFEPEFNKNDYLPKKADWGKLFDWIVSEAAPGHDRVRTYWYVTRYIDFCPNKFPDANLAPNELRNLLSKYWKYKKELDIITDDAIRVDKMKEMARKLNKRKDDFRSRYEGWGEIHDGISTRHEAIEFRRAGAITLNLFTNKLGPEKAVDVKLATDMVILRDNYDLAIIVSGDQDYVPAVQIVKDSGKRVVNVAFLTRGGELLPGGARRLNHVTDKSIKIPYQEFLKMLNIPRPAPMPATSAPPVGAGTSTATP